MRRDAGWGGGKEPGRVELDRESGGGEMGDHTRRRPQRDGMRPTTTELWRVDQRDVHLLYECGSCVSGGLFFAGGRGSKVFAGKTRLREERETREGRVGRWVIGKMWDEVG